MTDEARDWEQLRSDAIRAAREVVSDDELAQAVTDAILDVVDEETVRRLSDKLISETYLKSMDFRNGANMDIRPARALVAQWVGAARTLLEGAENYSETRVDFGIPEDPQRYSFVVQKAGKLTPHEARRRAEAECGELRAEVERLQAAGVIEWGVRYADWDGRVVPHASRADAVLARDDIAALKPDAAPVLVWRTAAISAGEWTEAESKESAAPTAAHHEGEAG